MVKKAADAFLPLNARVHAILLVLVDGPAHGYRIKNDVEIGSDQRLTLDVGSLYRIIARLVREGLIVEGAAPRNAGNDDARRRYYRLTKLGRQVAQAETRRLADLLVTPQARRALAGDQSSG